MEAPCSFLIPCPMRLLHLAVPELYPFIINWESSKVYLVSSVRYSNKLPKSSEGIMYNQSVRSTGNH